MLFGERKTSTGRYKRIRAKHSLELEMDRMQARKAKILDQFKFEMDPILSCIAKFFFKSFYEAAREVEMLEGGFKQVQVDLGFLSTCLEEIVVLEDQGLLTGYCSEIQQSAEARCMNPSAMDATVISIQVMESMIEHRKTKLSIISG